MSPPAAVEDNPPKWINEIDLNKLNNGTVVVLKSFTQEYRNGHLKIL